MRRLPDGSVLPSYLSAVSTMRMEQGVASNVVLIVGHIVRVIPVDHPDNKSKLVVEYHVDAEHSSSGTTTTRRHFGCVTSTMFGVPADFCHQTLRGPVGEVGGDDAYQPGARVLLLCIGGKVTSSIIVGAMSLKKEGTSEGHPPDTNEGHHFHYRFNGADLLINQDGELSIKINGATELNGELTEDVDEEAVGAYVTFDKLGGVCIATREGKEALTLVRAETLVRLQSMEGDVEIHAENQARIYHTEGVHIGEATDKTLMGETYRKEQKALHDDLQKKLIELTVQLGIISGAITAAMVPMGVPYGHIASVPLLTPVTVELGKSVKTVTEMGKALLKFESKASTYLSKKNKSD